MKTVASTILCMACILQLAFCFGCATQETSVDEGSAASTEAQDAELPLEAIAKTKDELQRAELQGATKSMKKWLDERLKQATDTGQDTAEVAQGTVDWATEMYESLKEQGLTTAGSASEWLSQDFNSIGAWEYKIVRISLDRRNAEKELNKLGADRWECFSIAPSGDPDVQNYHFKRMKKSYLKSLPMKDLMRLIPLMPGE